MRLSTYEQIEMNCHVARDTTDDEPNPILFENEDDQEEERRSPNLSMDEVREALDEFEEILRS